MHDGRIIFFQQVRKAYLSENCTTSQFEKKGA